MRSKDTEYQDDPKIIAEIVLARDYKRSVADYLTLHELYKRREDFELVQTRGNRVDKVIHRTNQRRLLKLQQSIEKYETKVAETRNGDDHNRIERDVIAAYISFRHSSDAKVIDLSSLHFR